MLNEDKMSPFFDQDGFILIYSAAFLGPLPTPVAEIIQSRTEFWIEKLKISRTVATEVTVGVLGRVRGSVESSA
jgi:hypothetical protein